MTLIPKKVKTVVHISTYDKMGGAAIAAWRLHEGMQRLGMDSRVVARHRTSDSQNVSCLSTPLFGASDLFNHQLVNPAQPKGATLFSLSPISISLLDHPWIVAADVIHLHWVAQFIAPEDIAKLCNAGKTVFWTFHDQWPYTGGCHYIGGFSRNESDWDGSAQIGPAIHALARMERQRKMKLFADLPIHVIAPSRWMAEEAVASGVFHQKQIQIVPYGINTSVFHPARFDSNTELESDHKVNLLFGCQNLGDPRKGYNKLREALMLCMSDSRFATAVQHGLIQIKTFGAIQEGALDLPISAMHLGTLAGELQVAEVLRASSAFICPTLEDNLPNLVMESLACGCPVIAFATGGIPDMVSHEANGLLVPKGDCEALSRRLIDFCLNKTLRHRLRDCAKHARLEDRSLETQASKILELYNAVTPTVGETNHSKAPDCLISFTTNARILPHFGTEMIQMLLGVKDILESRFSAQAEESNSKLSHVRDQNSEIHRQLLNLQTQQNQSTTDRDLLLMQLSQAHDELETYFLENRHISKEAAKLKLSVEKARQIKQQLSYRLGSTIVNNSRSFGGWLNMPFSLVRETLRFREGQRNKCDQKSKGSQKKYISKNARLPSAASSGHAAVLRVKQQLSYRIGNTFVRNARSPVGWIKLPFALIREIIDFKRTTRKKNPYQNSR